MTIAIPRLDRSSAAERGLTVGDFLVPIRVGDRLSTRVHHVTLVILGALIVAVAAQVAIPSLPVPFTGQTLGVLAVGTALGYRRGLAALILYLVLGTAGLPIFAAGDAGPARLLGPTGGYLIGFVLAAAIVGRLAELGWDRRVPAAIVAMLIGTAVIYAVGVPWLKFSLDLPWSQAVEAGMTKFLVWDAAKALVAGSVFPLAWWLVGRRPDDR